MPTAYNEGSRVRLQVTFKDAAGVVADPSVVTLKVRDSADVNTTYTYAAAEITKASTGIYYKDITLNRGGQWEFWFTGTSGLTAAAGDEITCAKARVA